MYTRQKGKFPLLANILGSVGYAFTAIVCLEFVVYVITQNRASNPSYSSVEFMVDIFLTTLIGIFILSPIWLIARFLLSIFPLIKLVPQGLRIRTLNRGDLILWSEIEHIVEFDNGVVALVIARRGNYLFNGLFFHKLCGFLIKYDDPVLFLALNSEEKEKVLTTIRKESRV